MPSRERIQAVIREYLYLDGTPPANRTWEDELHALDLLLFGKHRYTALQVCQMIVGLRLLADHQGVYGDEIDWLTPGAKMTLRPLFKMSGFAPVARMAQEAFFRHQNTSRHVKPSWTSIGDILRGKA